MSGDNKAGAVARSATSGGRVRPLLVTDDLVLAEFRCRPGDVRWDVRNNIGELPHVVFPRRRVLIERADRLCADSTLAVLYDAGQDYGRRMVDPDGDSCTFVSLTLRLLGELLGLPGQSGGAPSFRAGHAAVADPVWLRVHAVAARARRGCADPLLGEEQVVLALGDVLGDCAAQSSPSGCRADSVCVDRVDAARRALGRDLGGPMSLSDLGRELHVSPFHLARQFRAVTGSTVHAYRTQLRVRAAAQVVLERPHRDLTAIAASHGFASHSHFTKRFATAFGVTPSLVRRQVSGSAADPDEAAAR